MVSPLIALMQDQVDALLQLGVRAAFLNSSQDAEAAREVQRQLFAGELDLLYVAPERLVTEGFMRRLERMHAGHGLALFAIDEAHCVSQWGHDFRPEYLQLSILAERFPQVPRIALTATADALTRAEIVTKLKLDAGPPVRRQLRSPEHPLSGGREGQRAHAAQRLSRRASGRGRHRLLRFPQEGRQTPPNGWRTGAYARFPITPGSMRRPVGCTSSDSCARTAS